MEQNKKPEIYMGSDHRGLEIKQTIMQSLQAKGYVVHDLGPFTYKKQDDYTNYGIMVSRKVQQNPGSRGILLCGSGVGMYMVANKFKGIRASEARSVQEVKHDRGHHNSNILALGAETVGEDKFTDIINAWLEQDFEGGRHARRVKKISLIEEETMTNYPIGPLIVPSLLGASLEDYATLAEKFEFFTPQLHIDIMDEEFVATKSPQMEEVMKSLSKYNVFYNVHLMVKDPVPLLDKLVNNTKVRLVYVHAETINEALLQKEYPFDLGLVLSPGSDIQKYKSWYTQVPIVQIMTVKPGEYGADFIPSQLEIIEQIKNLNFRGEIHLDGGINKQTIESVLKFYPDMLNIGSAFAKSENPETTYYDFLDKIQNFLNANNE